MVLVCLHNVPAIFLDVFLETLKCQHIIRWPYLTESRNKGFPSVKTVAIIRNHWRSKSQPFYYYYYLVILTKGLVAAVSEPVGAATVMEAYQGLSVSNQCDAGSHDF